MTEKTSELFARILKLLGPDNIRRVLENPRENSMETILLAGILTVAAIIALLVTLVVVAKLFSLLRSIVLRMRQKS